MLWVVVGALLIGISLGLLGSGGSILTVPVLVYLLGHDDKIAIAESLGIVGGIAITAAMPYAKARTIDWRSVVLFGLPAMAGTYAGAWMAKYVPGAAQLILFAVVMLVAAWFMYRNPVRAASQADPGKNDDRQMSRSALGGDESAASKHPLWKIVIEGVAVGIVTGLVGVGGGFLIVPALVLLGGLSMRLAVGTSLVIIALKSATGFIKYLGNLQSLNLEVDWTTIGWFCLIGAAGSFVGKYVSSRLDQAALKRGFAVFLVVMAAFVLFMEIPKLVSSDEMKLPAKNAQLITEKHNERDPDWLGDHCRLDCSQHLGVAQTRHPDVNERGLRGGSARRQI